MNLREERRSMRRGSTFAALLLAALFAACGSERSARTGRKTTDPRPPEPADKAACREMKAMAVGASYSGGTGPGDGTPGTEHYTDYGTTGFVTTTKDSLSTFAIDVDTASYTIARRKVREGCLPPPASVRVEEIVNYFRQDYGDPAEGVFAVSLEGAPSPYRKGLHLLRVGVRGKNVSPSERKPANLVFLVDTSGSMQSDDKIGLVKRSLAILVDELRQGDKVSICTYAGGVSEVLPPTGAENKTKILAALEGLEAGGSTAMASGIVLAYDLASRAYVRGGINRVIVCSDGDANVGATSWEEMLSTIEDKVRQGVTLSTVGFGMGNYKDTNMEQLADKGNGNYAYVDSLMEAKRIFQEQVVGTLQVIAKDVKIQVEFDPACVARYRLIGYENRDIADRDFRNDAVDAGEVGSGHTVTALYEVELATKASASASLGTVRIRHKPPQGEKAEEEAFVLRASFVKDSFARASRTFRFTACAAEAAEILRKSPHVQTSLEQVARDAREAASPAGDDREQDFLGWITAAATLL
jgi:Ca-activated chloride channel family protein